MVIGIYGPLLIAAGTGVVVVLLLYTSWDFIIRHLSVITTGFIARMERTGSTGKAEELAISLLGIAVFAWAVIVLVLRPALPIAVLLLAAALVTAFGGFSLWLSYRARKRLDEFNQELEPLLRILASSLRVGLSLRQALTVMTQQTPQPARGEFARVLGQTNIGIAVNDAFDELRQRMPSPELDMMVHAIKIQSRSGGDLASILEHLASTIQQRRNIHSKVRALTAEGRASAIILTAIPIVLALVITVAQPHMAHAMFFTLLGRIGVVLATSLEVAGILTFRQLLRFEV